MSSIKKRLVVRFDCTQEYPADQYFSSGADTVVSSSVGRYREAGREQFSRFGYRFRIENIGQPHLAVIRYPDDKSRFICVMDGSTYDLSTGVVTGGTRPVSGQIQEIQHVFWTRFQDCSIVFMNCGDQEPAAIVSVDIYEIEDLAPVEIPVESHGPHRKLGIQYEDPCGPGVAEGAVDFSQWAQRVVSYARHTGQNSLAYPICWYHGPLFPSKREPSDLVQMTVAHDRKQYMAWTTHPTDWVAKLLELCEQNGVEFTAVVTLLRLGSLMQKMNINLESIQAGADTINNMLWCDQVQAGTNDWTVTYNAGNYRNLKKHFEETGEVFTHVPDSFSWVYGEKRDPAFPDCHTGPIFNPLHPLVQEAILGFVREIAERYGKSPAFKGISFNMWQSTILWLGSIRSGYDDYTISLFEKEMGFQIPIDNKSSQRFSKRYQFLTYNCRPAWIAWRCKKIHQLLCNIRDILRNARPDLKVTLTFCNEPFVRYLFGFSVGPSHQLYARPNMMDICRDAGLDITLCGTEPGIELDLPLLTLSENDSTMNRDHEYLDRQSLDTFRELPRQGVFIMNNWVESWGRTTWLDCDSSDDPSLASVGGGPAEGVFRTNCSFDPDGFWWDSQWRITHAFPAGVHFLEPYSHAVAELDSCSISRGGLFLDKAHTEDIRRFAQSYCALPAMKFYTVGSSTDPVAVRKLKQNKRRYFYAINREYYPVRVELSFSTAPDELIDLATNEVVEASSCWEIVLGPYELRTFSISQAVDVTDFTARPPVEIVEAILKEGNETLEKIESLAKTANYIPGLNELQKGIKSAIEKGHLAWLRHALGSYLVSRCKALVK